MTMNYLDKERILNAFYNQGVIIYRVGKYFLFKRDLSVMPMQNSATDAIITGILSSPKLDRELSTKHFDALLDEIRNELNKDVPSFIATERKAMWAIALQNKLLNFGKLTDFLNDNGIISYDKILFDSLKDEDFVAVYKAKNELLSLTSEREFVLFLKYLDSRGEL